MQVIPQWDDRTRKRQARRLFSGRKMRWQYHEVREIAASLHAEAKRLSQTLPEEARRAKPVPSVHVFQLYLAFTRTAATLADPIEFLELSNLEIAKLLQIPIDTVKRVIMWLGSNPIVHHGKTVLEKGLGVIDRVQRLGRALVNNFEMEVNRTAKTFLTTMGQAVLGLLERAAPKKRVWFKRKGDEKKKPSTPRPRVEPPPEVMSAEDAAMGFGADGLANMKLLMSFIT